jgi:hypothetical protein
MAISTVNTAAETQLPRPLTTSAPLCPLCPVLQLHTDTHPRRGGALLKLPFSCRNLQRSNRTKEHGARTRNTQEIK